MQIAVKIRSRVCRSYMTSDLDTAGLFFEDCIVGEIYVKDFTIWNRSEIELQWSLTMTNTQNTLQIGDYDTGSSIDITSIPAYSPKRLRVSFRPTDIGEFNYTIHIENLNDANNSLEVRVHASVHSIAREEILTISPGNVLDFADCCAGLAKKKEIVLRNISESPLDIVFTCDTPEVIFELRADEISSQDFKRINSAGESRLKRNFSSNFSARTSEISRSHGSLSSLDSSFVNGIDFDSPENVFGEFPAEDKDEGGTKIEEISLRPATERRICVCFKPEKESVTPEFRGSQLKQRKFRITLSYNPSTRKHDVERKTIQCVGKVSTSFIEVSPKKLEFGDTIGIIV
jgi:hypothetical protein